jgi:TolB-like protein/DNA-binding winged helix-turn-helix (wHTH) protein/Tfp pilus assembly protein PilF
MSSPTTSTPGPLRFGVFEVDRHTGELRKNGAKVRLEGQPFQILALLLERPGRLVTREELKEKLWAPDTFVDFDQSINASVKRLRDALGDSADSPCFIETLPRRGYRFIYPISGSAETQAGPQPRRLVFALLVAALAILAAFWVLNVVQVSERTEGPSPGGIRSIAVLPLKNVSGDPNQEYLAAGMTEMLITELGSIGALQVRSHQSVMRYRTTAKPLPEIARELNVDAILEGTVLSSNGRIRVTTNLIQAAPESHVFSEIYERDLQDILSVQSAVARDVAGRIQIQLTSQQRMRLSSSHPINPAAHAAYLKGRYHFSQSTAGGTRLAKEYFHKAVEIEPGFAPAYASLAELYARGGPAVTQDRRGPYWDARPKAREWAEKSLALDDTLAEAHTALARVGMMEWDWSTAEREFRRAVELNPSYPLARIWYAEYLNAMLRPDEALEQIRLARQLDPVSPYINSRVGWTYLAAGKVDEAISAFHEVLELEPNTLEPASVHPRVGLAQANLQKGLYTDAVAELEKALAADEKNPFALGWLAYAYAKLGRRKQALEIVSQLERRAQREPAPASTLVWAYVGLGDEDRALAWLEKAYQRRAWLWHINTSRALVPLRSNPRFQELERRVGLPQRRPPTVAERFPQTAGGVEKTER